MDWEKRGAVPYFLSTRLVANEIVPRLGLVEVLGKAYPKEIKFAKIKFAKVFV
ncbi:MAG: hypothetical protein KAI83_02585 [Thiomargarita sp.]|nr:hypothetical protein [Thiomargarita sp.]